MAKLVAVCRDEIDFAFERRQIPLNIEDALTVIKNLCQLCFISFGGEYKSVSVFVSSAVLLSSLLS